MLTVDDVARFLEDFAPTRLAEEWDNVGLLVGDRWRSAARIMTCLTVTPQSAAEAVDERADLIVTHHPLPFRAMKRLTTDTNEGRLLWSLIGAGISIYSPHTAFDSARDGINQQLAAGVGLERITPLTPSGDVQQAGTGRKGHFASPLSLQAIADRVKRFLHFDALQCVGDPGRRIDSVGVACGSAGELLPQAMQAGCECLITGETRFHTCLEAEAAGVALLLTGHFASERFGVEHLAGVLSERFAGATIWASRRETDPLRPI